MLKIAVKLNDLSFSNLMEVYIEGNLEKEDLLQAEQDFYQYLREVFFRTEGAVYCIWEEQGRYVSALRLEPYRDGWLLAALETAPEQRQKGYAGKLIGAVQEYYPDRKLYSHVSKRNVPSLKTHEKCGFRKILDYAVYADGSVLRSSVTLCWEKK